MHQKSKINLNMSEKAKIKQILIWRLAFFKINVKILEVVCPNILDYNTI